MSQQHSPSPASSVSFISQPAPFKGWSHLWGGIAPRSPMLRDAKLEAEAEREHDRIRRDAERGRLSRGDSLKTACWV
ncbi:uncharacterized protein LACBIDRAFT_306844 [Laccaria bicolor S238N-H82]|uniref:Predicted protein n=1 Tax=Laccaria bicolor (strain S238N-H82 / ATCC MYA-4686) TaxID=486041 RepID=B0DNU5_LACBS|nr:uncharacterized protein LACBIDRAFT_306844 [Laccaria bicolor S238N-H82]EDR03787.1 predicted protein [Laccaria bicolor S238N-H82]|eukprot:XP_001885640.1 predicted protein [Laccaria bicolor S238N-H82]